MRELAVDLAQRLQQLCRVLGALLDHMVFPEDLVPPDDPPAVARKALRVKLAEDLAEHSSTDDQQQPPAGRKFPLKRWPAIAGEALGSAGDEAEPASGGDEGAEPFEPLSTFATPSHRAIFASRDRVVTMMRTAVLETASDARSIAALRIKEEDAWQGNWRKMLAVLRRE